MQRIKKKCMLLCVDRIYNISPVHPPLTTCKDNQMYVSGKCNLHFFASLKANLSLYTELLVLDNLLIGLDLKHKQENQII